MERCAICGCGLNRGGGYAKPTIEGRSHVSNHHYVPERFFGRSENRRGEQRAKVFDHSPWGCEGEQGVFCYDCHEELLHNPILLPGDVEDFAELVRLRGLDELLKSDDRKKLAGRIVLLHEVLAAGMASLLDSERRSSG